MIEFFIEHNFSRRVFDIFIVDKAGETVSIGEPITMAKTDDNMVSPPPTLHLQREDIQSLFDSLWREGFRPESRQDIDGVLEATTRHLEDMRKIVFDLLGKEKIK